MLRIKRVYAAPAADDGKRVLVDRLWPRGLKKEAAALDEWRQELAPSDSLRKWFAHDPGKWEEFKGRFFAELQARPAAIEQLLDAARRGMVTLLYAAREEHYNNAEALREYLAAKLDRSP